MNITKGKRQQAQKVVIYGVPGIGKSTLASQFPDALFIDTEGSTNNLDVSRFDTPKTYEMIKEQIDYVKTNPTICKTLIIDTIDWADAKLVESLCAQHGKKGIEEFGYGQGYTYAKEELGRLLNKLTEIVNLGIHVVLLAHSQIVKFELPEEQGSYDRYQLKLTGKTAKRNAELILEWADMVLFCNFKTSVFAVDKNGNKHKAQGNSRVMYTSYNAVWEAKNRHGLPFELPLDYNLIKHIFEPQTASTNTVTVAPIVPIVPQITPKSVMQQMPEVSQVNAIQEQSMFTPTVPQNVPTVANNATIETIPQATTRPSYVPEKLWQLMIANEISVSEIEDALAVKGVLPKGSSIELLPEEFINQFLIGKWESMKSFIEKEIKNQSF